MTDRPKKIAIDSINLNLGGKKIELTIAECKTLHEKLTEMFGQIVHNHYNNNGVTFPYNPSPWITYATNNDGLTPRLGSLDPVSTCLLADTSIMPSGAAINGSTLSVDVA